ncbi:MAG: hydrogenase small subunit [Methylobacter sp.]|nr:hydrogenase small subunit [Methylobacter sp.]
MSNDSKKELRNSIAKRLSGHLEVETPDERPYIETLGERLAHADVSRRSFMKYCMGLSAMMAIPISLMPKLVEAALAKKTSVVYLSFQECTGCLESLVNVFPNTRYNLSATNSTDSIANIILSALSLDYQETLMVPSGLQAEQSKKDAIANTGYILVVDGALPDDKKGAGFFIQHGKTGLQLLKEAATNAAAIVSVGSCASFGGLPAAKGPANLINPTNARGVSPTGATSIKAALNGFGGIYKTKPVINVSGCPPIAEVIAGTLVYWILNKKAPELDSNLRPKMFYDETVHEECYRKEFFEEGLFVKSFDDAGARAGHCLLMMGCKGPTTHNACTTLKWNQRTGHPMEAGHGCLGCSEPDFWDKKSINAQGQQGVGFYNHLDPKSIDD